MLLTVYQNASVYELLRIYKFPEIKKGDVKPPLNQSLYFVIYYEEVVDELEVCNATTTAATAAAAIATVVAVAAAAPAAAPDAAADDPAAPALPLEAPAEDDDDCANEGTAKDITNTIVDIIFKIRIKLTPTFS